MPPCGRRCSVFPDRPRWPNSCCGRAGSLALHTGLIIIVLAITAPVTTSRLARPALLRQNQAARTAADHAGDTTAGES